MTTRPNRLSLLVAAGCAGLIALTSACSSSSGADNGGSAGQVSSNGVGLNGAPSEDPAKSVIEAIKADSSLSAKLPSSVKANGLTVATSEGYPPMEQFAKDGKTLVGVDPSLARAIGNRLGVKVNVVNSEDFNAQIPGVISGRFDMVMSTMTDTAQRQGKVTFVDYLSDGQGFVVKGGNPEKISQPSDTCGKTLAVVDNGSALELAQQISSDCKSTGKPAVTILKFTGDSDALLQVKNGRATADINDFPVAAYRAQTSNGALEAVQIKGNEAPLGIGMKPSNKALIDAVQAALNSLIQDGTYGKILAAWNISGMAVQSAELNGGK